MTAAIDHIDFETAKRLLSPGQAVAAIRAALQQGYRPETDHRRIADPLANGEFLIMPSETSTAAGVKVLTVAPGNPARTLQRIQGVYVLFDAETLTPRHLIDGAALTDLRTAAVSIAAVQDALLASTAPLPVVVYGASHQATAHIRTLTEVLDGKREIASVTAVVRNPDNVEDADLFTAVVRSGTPDADAATNRAGLVICTTTARTPLFDGALVDDQAVVIAVGSHEADARELDAALMSRANVVVEDLEVALRECGDVVMAVEEGTLAPDSLIPMADFVTGARQAASGRPLVFKSAGMPWEDLVIAEAIAARHH